MERGALAELVRTLGWRLSRRRLEQGILSTAFMTAAGLLVEGPAHAGKKCRPRCKGAEVCKRGECRCLPPAQRLRECRPEEIPTWCEPTKEGNPRVCCPARRIYVNCPLGESGLPEDKLCRAPEEEAPAVCCAKDKVCGKRCCEKPFSCEDAETSKCSGNPPSYARLKRA